jgi:hypothetical protein
MPADLHKIRRRREILAGLAIILAACSYITSLLLDFNFVSPYTTLNEDLSYLANNLRSQQISIWAWLFTSLITFLAIPPYIMLFHKRLRVLQYLNGLLILGASIGFFLMGIAGLELYRELAAGTLASLEKANEQEWLSLLSLYQDELFYRRVGSSFVGAFAFGLGLTRFKIKRFPLIATVLLMISGPTMIVLNWYDPEHLVRTAAMAGNIIGISIFSVRIINKGLDEKVSDPLESREETQEETSP